MFKRTLAVMLAATTSVAALHAPAACAQENQQSYDIAAQDLGSAIRQYSEASGRDVIAASSLVNGKRSKAVRGRLSADAALAHLLSGTNLVVERVDGTLIIRAGNADANVGATDRESAAIVVTGTRIRGTGPVGSPVTTVDREVLDRSGRATLSDFLKLIPQNFSGGPSEATFGSSARSNANTNISFGSGVNLRGLGSASTLTLFDGTRPAMGGNWGAFTDLSLIPSSAIDRIEILTDGASAIYGSDAVAGVVNLRFRNQFEGAETRIRAGTADGDFSETQISQLLGKKWGSGNLVFAAEYYTRGNLPAYKRRFTNEDLRPFGGPDLRSTYANPGTIIAADGRVFAIPAGQDGRNLTAGDLIEGVINRDDGQRLIDILPRQHSLSFYGSAEQEVGPVTLFARGLFADRRYRAHMRRFGPSPLTVTSSNPYYVDPIGTGQPVTVFYDPSADFGPEGVQGRARALNLSGGARTDIGTWSVEISGGYGTQHERGDDFNIIHFTRLAEALASSDPAKALNVFGDGAVNDPALIDSLRGGLTSRVRSRVWTAALRADGILLKLPAGAVKLAIGGELRGERLDFTSVYNMYGNDQLTSRLPGLPGKRTVRSLYGEIIVPLFDAGAVLPGSLQFSLAGRYEDYSDVGDTSNPKVGLRWAPGRGVAIRASYGRSFRAPFFTELVGAANATYQPVYLPDPQSPTGQTLALALLGFRPGLGPEKATSWTAGVDLEPQAIPGLKLSATWFDIAYRGRIANASFDIFNFLTRRDIYGELVNETPDPAEVAAYFANPNLRNPLGVAASDIEVIADARTFNLSRVTIRGLDFDLSYRHPIGNGAVTLWMGGSRLFNIDQRVTNAAPPVNAVGTLGNPVKLRLRGRLGFETGPFDGGFSVLHSSGYRNQTATPAEKVKSWTTFDLQLGTRIAATPGGRAFRLALNVNNLFDKDPPYVLYRSATTVLGYDPEQGSAIGRTISLQGIVTW